MFFAVAEGICSLHLVLCSSPLLSVILSASARYLFNPVFFYIVVYLIGFCIVLCNFFVYPLLYLYILLLLLLLLF